MGIWQITSKDLKLLVRDRRALMVLVLLPLAFITILGLTTGRLLGWKAENQLLTIAVANESDGDLVRQIVDAIADRDGIRVRCVPTVAEARRLVESREANVAWIIGSEFASRVETLKLRDILDSRHGALSTGLSALAMSIESRASASGVRSITRHLILATSLQVIAPYVARKNRIVNRLLKSSAANTPAEQTARPATGDAAPNTQDNASSPVYETLVPAFSVMFVFFLVNIMARSFLSERETGTLQRLRITPITSISLLVGKIVPFLIISLIQSVLLFVFGKILFGMSWGNQPWLLVPVIACTSLSATGLGLLVATIVRSDSQVSAYANFLVITMAGISGCFMPRDWLPELMQTISLSTPHAWALIAYDQVLSRTAPDLVVVAECCLMLLAFSALYLLLGAWRFRSVQ